MSGSPIKDVIPPFLSGSQKAEGTQGSGTSPVVTKFLKIDPCQLKFTFESNGPVKRVVQISNISNLRVAWRLVTNAPTRYVVNPACGFLTKDEGQAISIELMDSSKYSDHHRFIVQAMEAKDDEKDRRKIWHSPKVTALEGIQSVRVFPVGVAGSKPSTPSGSKPSTPSGSRSESSESVSSVLTGSSGTEAATGSSVSESQSSVTTATGSLSASSLCSVSSSGSASSIGDAEMNARIKDLSDVVRTTILKKETLDAELKQNFIQIKALEVELDHAGRECQELEDRYRLLITQIDDLEKRAKALEEESAYLRRMGP